VDVTAWIDDRIWCHPKFTGLSGNAFAVYVKGVAYASGMATNGVLDVEVQRMLGTTPAVRKELVTANLWDPNGVGVVIHDWEEHNGARDRRRVRERERMRETRRRKKQ